MSTEIIQAHVKMKKADRERIDALGRIWRIKSTNAIILEAIRSAYEVEQAIRRKQAHNEHI